jgi:DNA processing protein
MDNRQFLVAISSFIPFGPIRIKLLLTYFGSAEAVWKARKSELIRIGINEKTAENFDTFRKTFKAESYFVKLKNLGIEYVVQADEGFPVNLKGVDDSPVCLYYLGNIKAATRNSIAIVGSRKMTAYGREVAAKFAGELALLGIEIVSGLAIGIDTTAHRSALEAGGRCVAVLATGLDAVTPLRNRWLAAKIVEKNGCLVSEYPLYYPALKINFARRNRIISGISNAVVVVEGEAKSGTLLTASSAAEQGRTVFAVPGQIMSPTSCAPHFLIKNGARMLTEIADVLDELDLQLKVDKQVYESIMPQTREEVEIYELLTKEALHLDEVARIMGVAVGEISARLTIMELKGMVKSLGGGVYKKV